MSSTPSSTRSAHPPARPLAARGATSPQAPAGRPGSPAARPGASQAAQPTSLLRPSRLTPSAFPTLPRRPSSSTADYDPLWAQIRAEVLRDAASEPILSSYLYSCVLSHNSFERSLSFVLANRLSDATLLATQLTEIFTSILESEPGARAAESGGAARGVGFLPGCCRSGCVLHCLTGEPPSLRQPGACAGRRHPHRRQGRPRRHPPPRPGVPHLRRLPPLLQGSARQDAPLSPTPHLPSAP